MWNMAKSGWFRNEANRFVYQYPPELLLGRCIGSRRGLNRLLFGLWHLYIAQRMVAVYANKVDISAYAGTTPGLGILPKGETRRGIATIVGYEYVVLGILLRGEMCLVQLLAGVDYRLHTILVLHQFQQLVHTFHIEPACVVSLDVKHRHQFLILLFHHLAFVRHLLLFRGRAAL